MVDSVQKSLDFIKNMFQNYYKTSNIQLPDRFARREFAFTFFGGKGMVRHLSFDKRKDVLNFLNERIPQHVYYSSAYYQTPDAPRMQDKQWMGAELIFDLDSDHLPNTERLSYGEQLEIVKIEFEKLVKEFLMEDFGFDNKYLELYFSGGRGYHCHVKDPAIFDLDSNERREIVDYITGRNLQDSYIFREHVTSKKQYGKRNFPGGKRLQMPTPNQKGWKGRISREIIEIVDEIKKSENPKESLKEYGVKEKDAENLAKELSEERVRRIKDGFLDQSKTIRKFFLNRALRKTAVTLSAGETDEPVTCDIKRLIRLPSSLHGKTGFMVKKVDIDNLPDFNPLKDAVVFDDEPIDINLTTSFKIRMKEEDFNLEKGLQKVPSYLAVFLIGRKIAQIP